MSVALITGASRGLGAALMHTLSAAGWTVVGVARGEDDLHAVVHRIRSSGGSAYAVVADVGEPGSAARIVGEAVAKAGPIDLLVNNASTLGQTPLPLVLDLDEDNLRRILEVNTIAPLRLMRAAAGAMVLRGQGVIVNVSSDAATEPYPEWGGYGASKAALDQLSNVLAAELDGTGVRVITIEPGDMDTAMHREALPDSDPASLRRPADVARAVLPLIVDAPSGRHAVEVTR